MSMMLMVKVMGMKVGGHARKLILLKLADNSNDAGECFPSYQNIADHCEMTKRSVMSHIKKLSDDGLITIKARKTPNGNTSNIYKLTLSCDEKTPDLPSENISPPSENISPPSENFSLPPSENFSPRTSHSFEPVIEPKEINKEISKKYLFEFPDWIDGAAMDEWLQFRKKLKASNSPRALKSIIKDLEEIRNAGIDSTTAIDTAIKRGWKTVELSYLTNLGGLHATRQQVNTDKQSAYLDELARA